MMPESPRLDLNGPHDVPYRRFDPAWVEQPALDLFRASTDEHATRIACHDGISGLTYNRTWCIAQALAAAIRLQPGRAVGVLLPNDAHYPAAVIACLAAGRVCVMIDRHHPAERVATILRDAGVTTVIIRRADLGGNLLPAGLRTIVVEDATEASDSTPPAPAADARWTPDEPCFVIYTSGSTGQPKGIALSQRGVLHRAAELINAVHMRLDDRVLSLASPSTIGGLQQIFEVMLCGATLFKLDLQRLSLERVLQEVEQHRITMMFSTPSVWRSVARIDGARRSLASLRCIQTSGDALLRVDLEAMRSVLPTACHVLSVYGASEVPAVLQWFVAATATDEGARVPAGYPLPDIKLALLDEAGAEQQTMGELVVKSRWTACGVWRDGALSPGSFEPVLADPTARLYRTGDLMERRTDGLYVFLGRKDRQIKIRGNRVELADIETALRRDPLVADAAVVARTVEGEARLWAFAVPRGRQASDFTPRLRARLAEALPAYMRPSRIVPVEELPLLPGRKVDEEALLKLALRPATSFDAAAAPTVRAGTRATEVVEKAWRLTFGRRPPPSDESFEEYSGDSLRLLQLVFHLERLSGRALPLERFHGELRPSEFAVELDRQWHSDTQPRRGDRPIVYFVPGFGGDEPRLGRFRAACAEMLDVRPLHYPDLARLAAPGASFDDIAGHIVEQVLRDGPPAPLRIAGYSVGGDVAYAAAVRLAARGHRVDLLLIFDTDTGGEAPAAPPRRGVARSNPLVRLRDIARGGDWNELASALLPAHRVARPAMRRIVRAIAPMNRIVTSNFSFYLKRQLHEALVVTHHSAWLRAAKPRLDSPVVLFRSGERRAGAADLGWGARAGAIETIPVAGDHFTMFSPANVGALARQFDAALRR